MSGSTSGRCHTPVGAGLGLGPWRRPSRDVLHGRGSLHGDSLLKRDTHDACAPGELYGNAVQQRCVYRISSSSSYLLLLLHGCWRWGCTRLLAEWAPRGAWAWENPF